MSTHVIERGAGAHAHLSTTARTHVAWLLGAAMAVCNIAGAPPPARPAPRKGSGFVRIVLLVVVLALIVKLGVDQFTMS